MALFGIGNILLKTKRAKLPRPEKAKWISVIVAIVAVIFALTGNIIMEPKEGVPSNLTVFLDYFIPFMIFIIIMLNRTVLLKFVLNFIHYIFNPLRRSVFKTDKKLLTIIQKINEQEFVFFTKGDRIEMLNKAILYIKGNEHTNNVKIVYVKEKGTEIPPNLKQEIDFLNKAYPDINIDFVIEDGKFTPEKIRSLSEKWNVPINFMFIGSPTDKFPYKIEELGGVRLII